MIENEKVKIENGEPILISSPLFTNYLRARGGTKVMPKSQGCSIHVS